MQLTPKQVYDEFGIAREQLLKMEKDGRLNDVMRRTSGGHRRYDRVGIERLAKQEEEVRFTEFGTTGIRRFGSTVYEERIRELQGRNGRILMREMRVNDPIISAIFFAIGNAHRQANWRVQPASTAEPDVLAAEFVKTCLFDMSFSWNDQMTFIFDPMFEQGFSALEVVYKKRLGLIPPDYVDDPAMSMYNDGRVGWRKWAPRAAESLSPGNEWEYDENGGIQGLNQQVETSAPPGKMEEIFIPIEKLLLFRTTPHPNNTPEGMPIHRSMYIPWWYSNQLQEVEGIAVERNLTGIPVVYMGRDCSFTGANSDFDQAKDLVTNIRIDEQTGIVFPHAKMGSGATEGDGILLELLSAKAGVEGAGGGVGEIIERYDKRKAVTILAQFIMLGMDRVGSFALSKNQSDLFVLAVSAFLLSVADVINRHGIPKLIMMNTFPGITGFPQLIPGTLGIPDLQGVSEYVNKLVDKNVLTPDDDLESHLRQVGGLPQRIVKVEGEETSSDLGRTRESSALLLRRIGLAIESMKRLEVLSEGEADSMIRPLIEEFKIQLQKQDNPGEEFERQLFEEIDQAWADFQKQVGQIHPDDPERERTIAALLLLVRQRIAKATEDTYRGVWAKTRTGRVEFEELDEVAKAAQTAMGYFDGFMGELENEFATLETQDEFVEKVEKRRSRALMYAGGVWALYNLAKVYGRKQSELWEWEGGIDTESCPCCVIQVAAGPRPLSAMTILPGGCSCLSRCRHELVKA